MNASYFTMRAGQNYKLSRPENLGVESVEYFFGQSQFLKSFVALFISNSIGQGNAKQESLTDTQNDSYDDPPHRPLGDLVFYFYKFVIQYNSIVIPLSLC